MEKKVTELFVSHIQHHSFLKLVLQKMTRNT